MEEPTYAPLYLEGIEQFNKRNYFQSHELWEELWVSEEEPNKTFYKGLIQAAVALYHYEKGNVHGAKKLLGGSQAYLAPYVPHYAGLDVERFLAEMGRCLAGVVDLQNRPSPEERQSIKAPQIRLEPSPDPPPA